MRTQKPHKKKIALSAEASEYDAIVGILLAAGCGSRFGSDKLLHPLPDGTPMAVSAAENFMSACDRTIAVVRHDSEEIHKLFTDMGCEVVICPSAEAGMGHSLAAGVNAAHYAAGWVVALADMPFIASTSHQAVVNGLRNGASITACQFNGQRGHPVGFAAHWFEYLANLTGDQGGKSILKDNLHEVILCPVDDPGVLWDIDRPEDLSAR